MENPIYVPAIGFVITQRCTLACKLCAEYSPYYDNNTHATFEVIKNTIDNVFKYIDQFGDISFFGGEPFFHKDICNCIRYAGKYLDRVKRVLILTNATIMPNEEEFTKLMEDIPEYHGKLQFNISDYGPGLSSHVKEMEEFCKRLGIKARQIKYYGEDMFCNGWIDYGDHSQKYFTLAEIKDHAKKCHFRKHVSLCTHITDDMVYLSRCSRSFWRNMLGITPSDTDDLVRIPQKPEDAKDFEIRDKIRTLINAEYSDSCAFCNGMCDDSPRFPPAEQFKSEELKQIRKMRY